MEAPKDFQLHVGSDEGGFWCLGGSDETCVGDGVGSGDHDGFLLGGGGSSFLLRNGGVIVVVVFVYSTDSNYERIELRS